MRCHCHDDLSFVVTSRADMRSLAVVSPCFYEAAYPYVQGGALDAFLNALISPLYLYIEVYARFPDYGGRWVDVQVNGKMMRIAEGIPGV